MVAARSPRRQPPRLNVLHEPVETTGGAGQVVLGGRGDDQQPPGEGLPYVLRHLQGAHRTVRVPQSSGDAVVEFELTVAFHAADCATLGLVSPPKPPTPVS
jgi:hypothetical protein